MRNIRLTLAYDGTDYVGWQKQPNGRSVQSTVESAVAQLTGEPAKLIAAGRTDAGVHALGQVANFRTNASLSCDNIRTGLQHFVPADISIRAVEDVPLDFHATYSAKQKRYRYVIHNSAITHPFLRMYAWRLTGELDAGAMHAAGGVLVGRHDFRSFESHFPNKATSVRTVSELTVRRSHIWPLAGIGQPQALPPPSSDQGEFVVLDIVADGFLYNMVRAIVGTLIKVGRGQWTAADVGRILEQQDRAGAGETAPAHGLYLVCVDYDEE